MSDTFTLAGTTANMVRPNSATLAASLMVFSFSAGRFCSIPTDKITQAAGIMNLNATSPRIVSRYFSRYSAQMTMTKYPLISASLSARGVATSPGISVIAAEEAVEAAVSSMTVFFFSSSAAIVLAYRAGSLAIFAIGKNERSATMSSMTT